MREQFRILRCSAWLAWQMESNWTSPWLFGIYVLAKPLAATALLVCMCWAVSAAGGAAPVEGLLPSLYVGSACYMLVAGVTAGMSEAVIFDREKYGMLKYVRISPARLPSYLIGRGLARAAVAMLGAGIALLAGLLVLPEVRAQLLGHGTAWGWLFVYLAGGTIMLMALGLILAGAMLNLPRYGTFLSEAVVGGLYLLSGVIFPVTALPSWLRPVSLVLPTTYWLEGMRRALLGPVPALSPVATWGHGRIALALVAGTAALGAFAVYSFRWSERRAWQMGRCDEISGY